MLSRAMAVGIHHHSLAEHIVRRGEIQDIVHNLKSHPEMVPVFLNGARLGGLKIVSRKY